MARPIDRPAPTSSVARLLKQETITRALAPVTPDAREPIASCDAAPQLVKRDIVLTTDTTAILDGLIDGFRSGTHCRLSGSHLLRAILVVLRPHLSSFKSALAACQPWKLPPNGGAHTAAREEFEARLAQVIAAVLSEPKHSRS